MTLQVVTVKWPWRLRLRVRRLQLRAWASRVRRFPRRRTRLAVLELEREHRRAIERAFLFGEGGRQDTS